jgi:hypothetical protein
MNSNKCSNCGLVNYPNETKCNRCGNSLSVQNSLPSNKTRDYTTKSIDFTDANRRIGFQALAFGIVCSILPWVLTFVFDIYSVKLNYISMVFGLSCVVAGIGIAMSPPKSKLDADENKPQNGLLILGGLILGLIEAYFFNKSLGLW